MFVNRSHLLIENPPQLHYGIAVTDIDGDGQFEIFVTGFGHPNQLLKWRGSRFINIINPILMDATRSAIAVAAADIDGDGREEIYILNSDTFAGRKEFADRLFDDNGSNWVDLFSLPENRAILNLTAGRSVACVDRFSRGTYGMFVANYGGPMRLYEMDDDGQLHDAAPEAGVDLITGGRSLLALPIVSEYMDVFAGNEQGPNFLFRNLGDGTFENVAEALGITDKFEHVRGVAVLDANGDGYFDLVYGNWEGPHRLFLQNPRGVWHNIAPSSMAFPSKVRTVIVADFDNDGYEEIFFNNMGEPNRLFGMRDGHWTELYIGEAEEPTGLGTGAAVGDFNNDGRLELIITHGEIARQPMTFYQTRENDNHWIRILPLTRYGAPARGAVVKCVAGGRTQIRAIDAGSGYLCQMEPVAHFGLGSIAKVERVEVRWCDGTTHIIPNPWINQQMTVEYPESDIIKFWDI